MRIVDWSADVCSSDLASYVVARFQGARGAGYRFGTWNGSIPRQAARVAWGPRSRERSAVRVGRGERRRGGGPGDSGGRRNRDRQSRSEEHTSELQSLMRISYAVFCLQNKNAY